MQTTTSEETLKYNVHKDYFKGCNYFPDFHKIDAAMEYKNTPVLWAEAKPKPTDINVMFAQLIFTVYKVQKEHETPRYLAVFDNEKIAFIPYNLIEPLFNEMKNVDFDWTVRPSDTNTKEFKQISDIIKNAIEHKNILYEYENLYDFKQLVFHFKKDKKLLQDWINANITIDEAKGPTRITDENFHKVYNRWRDEVKNSINEDWEAVKRDWGILDCDYFLADLFAEDNKTIHEKLFVLLKSDEYRVENKDKAKQMALYDKRITSFNDNQAAHKQFWNRYIRPPESQYWDLILKRRDLLVPQDIRERLGAFFTPSEWVLLAQKYMADTWGDLSDYYIWDCAGGTGNLLQGLDNLLQESYNPANLFISDINIENVYVMRGRIEKGELNLLSNHCFQFDFLNDEFALLPDKLLNIIKNEPEKLIIFINPPYADASSNMKTAKKEGNSFTKIHEKYQKDLGAFAREIFAQFLTRTYKEIPNCKIAVFSKLKLFAVNHAKKMQEWWFAKFMKGFIVPANSFDNVDGQFPIGFQCWDTSIKERIKDCKFDVYNFKKK